MIYSILNYHSEIFGRQTSNTILLPKNYKDNHPYLIILSPKNSDHSTLMRYTNIERLFEDKDYIIVIPDVSKANYDENDIYDFELIFGEELPKKIEHFYNVSKNKNDHYILGMGIGEKGAKNIFEKYDNFSKIYTIPENIDDDIWDYYSNVLEELIKEI